MLNPLIDTHHQHTGSRSGEGLWRVAQDKDKSEYFMVVVLLFHIVPSVYSNNIFPVSGLCAEL